MADFHREYGLDSTALAALSWPDFAWRLAGLSDRSRFRVAWTNEPKHVHDPEERARITALARR